MRSPLSISPEPMIAAPARRLSSRWTAFYTVVLPVLALAGGLGLVVQIVREAGPPVPGGAVEQTILTTFVAIALGAAAWLCLRLKTVWLAPDRMIVAGWRATIEVPLRDVVEVSASILTNPELVWVRVRSRTRFGSRIVFIPPARWTLGLSRHPVVAELRALVAASTHAG